MEKHCFNVIIAGGKGTRFWPLSRAQRPKQLLKILSRKSLIDETAERVYGLGGRARTVVVTVAEQVGALKKELSALPKNNFLAEPLGKNTAPCIGLAALEVMRRDPNGVMVVLPADHWVADVKGFQRTLKSAVVLAKKRDQLVTIGIRPDYPETGYGYIMKSGKLTAAGSTFQVKKFTEKPNEVAAKKLIRQGSLWNSGIFVWKASLLLGLLNRYQPEIGAALSRIAKAAAGKPLASPEPRFTSTIAREYGRMPSISIDFAVLEKAGAEGKVITVEADFGWSDVGSWAAVHRMMRQGRTRQRRQRPLDADRREKLPDSFPRSSSRAVGHRQCRRRRYPRRLSWSAISIAPRKCAISSPNSSARAWAAIPSSKSID